MWKRRPPVPAFLVYLCVFAAGVLAERKGWVPGRPDPFPIFRQARELIDANFVDRANLSNSTLEQGAIIGMVRSLGDPGHTIYLTKEQRTRHKEGLAGRLDGIGIRVASVSGKPVIVQTTPKSPARKAGLRVGDRVVAIDGEHVATVSPYALAERLRGKEGTSALVRIIRPPEKEPREFSVTRTRLETPEISWHLLPGEPRIAHLAFLRFTVKSGEQIRTALEEMKKHDVRGLVLDLRGNGGGYKDEAVKIAGEFLPEGTVVLLQRDAKEKEQKLTVPTDGKAGGTWLDRPVAVLVDGTSASAAEILAGALQDHDRAKVYGTRTYGTGTVLRDYPLRDGSGLLLAIGVWMTPKGREIRDSGITPDEIVTLPSTAMPVLPDDQTPLTPERLRAAGDAPLSRAHEALLRQAK